MDSGRADDGETGKLGKLVSAWENIDDSAFDIWIQMVSNAYFESGLGLKFAATLLGVRPAELQAALSLATLSEEDLSDLAEVRLPKTTWFSFASASSEAITSAIKALRGSKVSDSPFFVVEKAIREVSGPNSMERVMAMSSTCFSHASKKAKSYGLLSDKSQGALRSFGVSVHSGRPLTLKQAAYAKDLLQQLVDGGAISRDSPDEDRSICDEILDAIKDD
jgi:hypothetical protein